MTRLTALVSTVLLFAATSGCARSAPVLQAPVQTPSRQAEARLFDRFEAKIVREAKTGLACLAITAKGLITKFEDDDFTVVQSLPATRSNDDNQRVLFNSPLLLGQDGFLYLRESLKGRPTGHFYRVGAYGEAARGGDEVPFKLSGGLKLEARNRSILPVHGGGPFIAIVAEEMPVPSSQAPHLVRKK